MSRIRSAPSLSSVYLFGQAIATLLWWGALLADPAIRGRFELAGGDHRVLSSFLLGDLVAFFGGSLLGAVGLRRNAPWGSSVVAMTAGAAGYATLYLVAWVAQGGAGWLGLVAMIPAAAITASIAWRGRGTAR